MAGRGGYAALPHSAVECEQQQQPGGYGVYGSQGTTTPYNPQLQQVQQPGYCDPQQQYVQPPNYQSSLRCNLPASQHPQPPFNPSAEYVPPLANLSNQHSNVNVVVCQPQNQKTSSVVPQAPRAKSYFTVAITLFMFCLMYGNLPALTCLIPALICAAVASNHDSNGQYQSARTCEKLSICSSSSSIVFIFVLVIVGVMFVLLLYFYAWI